MEYLWELIWSSLRLASPLCFAALGGLLSERSGVINLALEGTMLIGAFTAAAVTSLTHEPFLGFAAAALVGAMYTAILGFFSLTLGAQQVVVGMGLNILAFGMTPYLNKLLFGVTSSTPSLDSADRLSYEPLVLLFFLILLIQFGLKHMRFGLWLRTAGEEAKALDAAGISRLATRWAGVLLSGVLAAWGGAVLSVMLASQFTRQMTAGAGFMAIAALILGRWQVLPTALVCLFFGLTDAGQIRLQQILSEAGEKRWLALLPLLPYLVTLAVLALQGGRMRAPRELGRST